MVNDPTDKYRPFTIYSHSPFTIHQFLMLHGGPEERERVGGLLARDVASTMTHLPPLPPLSRYCNTIVTTVPPPAPHLHCQLYCHHPDAHEYTHCPTCFAGPASELRRFRFDSSDSRGGRRERTASVLRVRVASSSAGQLHLPCIRMNTHTCVHYPAAVPYPLSLTSLRDW